MSFGLNPSPFPTQALVLTHLKHKSFENTVEKGEIARNEQFLLFPTVFSTHLENLLPFSSNLITRAPHAGANAWLFTKCHGFCTTTPRL